MFCFHSCSCAYLICLFCYKVVDCYFQYPF
uniref:Uncharacterized protein n=1 Tax=Arundo donax TaxID=35708 RepID=A0A0A9F446_ARUDO